MKRFLLMMMLSSTMSFGMSLNTEVLIDFPHEKIMSINIEMCVSTVGMTNKETLLKEDFTLKKHPPQHEVETLQVALEGIIIVGTFLKVIEEFLENSSVEDLSAFSVSETPMKVLITRPLLPMFVDFVRRFDNTYIVRKPEEDSLSTLADDVEKVNDEWDENIREIYLSQ